MNFSTAISFLKTSSRIVALENQKKATSSEKKIYIKTYLKVYIQFSEGIKAPEHMWNSHP